MSKRRNIRIITQLNRKDQRSFQQSLNNYRVTRNKTIEKSSGLNIRQQTISLCLPSSRKQDNQNATITAYRQKLANKNISIYRDIFNQNDNSMLPFMTSLRKKDFFLRKNNSHSIQKPPKVAFKTTMNQKFIKKVNDIQAEKTRISQIYYRWNNKSGISIKSNTEFQCSLRAYRSKLNPQKRFDTEIRPQKYKDCEQKVYSRQDLLCPKQNRLFKVK